MIEIYLKYDNMHTFGMINALNCINNHVNSSINSMLSLTPKVNSPFYWAFHDELIAVPDSIKT